MAEKILIVDDDIDSLKLIGLMLQRHGYEVVAANAGSQAISKAVNERPDLIILDVMMPDMDGYEVCRRLRAEHVTVNIPIIMFTAKTLIDDKIIGFEAGADDYLTKPTHPAELASRVKAMLARYREKNANNPVATPEPPQQMSGNTGRIGTPPPAPDNRGSAARSSVIQPVAPPPQQRANFDF
ncbi:MAG: response regulator transcription factor, partial [Phototrophicaceae bacterium]